MSAEGTVSGNRSVCKREARASIVKEAKTSTAAMMMTSFSQPASWTVSPAEVGKRLMIELVRSKSVDRLSSANLKTDRHLGLPAVLPRYQRCGKLTCGTTLSHTEFVLAQSDSGCSSDAMQVVGRSAASLQALRSCFAPLHSFHLCRMLASQSSHHMLDDMIKFVRTGCQVWAQSRSPHNRLHVPDLACSVICGFIVCNLP